MKAGHILGWIYLAALFTFIFAPIAASLVFSFNSDRFPTLPLGSFTTEWYARAFSCPEVWEALGNSLIVAGVTSVISTFIGFATAYTDFRYGFRFKQAYLALALLPPTLPLVILGLAMLAWLSQVGLSGTLTGIIIAHVVLATPLPWPSAACACPRWTPRSRLRHGTLARANGRRCPMSSCPSACSPSCRPFA